MLGAAIVIFDLGALLGRDQALRRLGELEFGQEMAWIHAKERKFVGMLERGDFGRAS